MEDVVVDIDGVKTMVNLEFIEIMDEKDLYLSLLGIPWEFDSNEIIILKKRNISFETKDLRVVSPLDHIEGQWFTNPINDDAQSSILENIYNITVHKDDYIIPIIDSEISCRSIVPMI